MFQGVLLKDLLTRAAATLAIGSTGFGLPGGLNGAAYLAGARTLVERAERGYEVADVLPCRRINENAVRKAPDTDDAHLTLGIETKELEAGGRFQPQVRGSSAHS
jgi:hypothetical protein